MKDVFRLIDLERKGNYINDEGEISYILRTLF